jgi:hypothetical protein
VPHKNKLIKNFSVGSSLLVLAHRITFFQKPVDTVNNKMNSRLLFLLTKGAAFAMIEPAAETDHL